MTQSAESHKYMNKIENRKRKDFNLLPTAGVFVIKQNMITIITVYDH